MTVITAYMMAHQEKSWLTIERLDQSGQVRMIHNDTGLLKDLALVIASYVGQHQPHVPKKVEEEIEQPLDREVLPTWSYGSMTASFGFMRPLG